MKRLAVLMAMLACAGLVGSVLWAQETAQPKEPKKEPTTKRAGPAEPYAEMVKVLNLSEELQGKIRELVAAEQKAAPELEAKVKAARAAAQEAQAAREELRRKLNTGVLALLTAEQKARWYEHLAMTRIVRDFGKANLTEEQMAKVKAAYVTVTTGVNLDDEKACQAALQKLSAQVKKEVLTDAQREALEKKPETRRAEAKK